MRDEKIAYSVTESDNVFIFLNFKKVVDDYSEKESRDQLCMHAFCVYLA